MDQGARAKSTLISRTKRVHEDQRETGVGVIRSDGIARKHNDTSLPARKI